MRYRMAKIGHSELYPTDETEWSNHLHIIKRCYMKEQNVYSIRKRRMEITSTPLTSWSLELNAKQWTNRFQTLTKTMNNTKSKQLDICSNIRCNFWNSSWLEYEWWHCSIVIFENYDHYKSMAFNAWKQKYSETLFKADNS